MTDTNCNSLCGLFLHNLLPRKFNGPFYFPLIICFIQSGWPGIGAVNCSSRHNPSGPIQLFTDFKSICEKSLLVSDLESASLIFI